MQPLPDYSWGPIEQNPLDPRHARAERVDTILQRLEEPWKKNTGIVGDKLADPRGDPPTTTPDNTWSMVGCADFVYFFTTPSALS